MSYHSPQPAASDGHRIAYYALRATVVLILAYLYFIGAALGVMGVVSLSRDRPESQMLFVSPVLIASATALLFVTNRWFRQLATRWVLGKRFNDANPRH